MSDEESYTAKDLIKHMTEVQDDMISCCFNHSIDIEAAHGLKPYDVLVLAQMSILAFSYYAAEVVDEHTLVTMLKNSAVKAKEILDHGENKTVH